MILVGKKEKNILESILGSIDELVIKAAPGLLSDNGVLAIFNLLIICVLILPPTFIFINLFRGIKDSQKRTALFISSTIVIMDIIFIAILKRIDLISMGLILFLNIIFFGLYKLSRIKKDSPLAIFSAGNLHFNELNAKKSGLKISPCPSCNKLTISAFHALHSVQACGECGANIQIKKSFFNFGNIFGTLIIFTVIGMVYLKMTDALPSQNFPIIVFGVLIFAGCVIAPTRKVSLEEISPLQKNDK